MRTKRTSQISIFDQFAQHEIGRELAAMSAWLDAAQHSIFAKFIVDRQDPDRMDVFRMAS